MAGKETALHDQIILDGTDISNLCDGVETESENEEQDASGFSVSGNDETLAGKRVQAIVLSVFFTEELHALAWPIHRDRENASILWRPNGLIDPGRPALFGNAKLLTYPPGAARGEVRKASLRFTPGDEDGFDWSAGS